MSSPSSSEQELLRYSRHLLLPQMGELGQQKLASASVLIVGLGGLGSPAAMYLAASGVQRLVLVDHDQVELSNLQRQIVHTTQSIGQDKTASAAQRLKEINPTIEVLTYTIKADRDNLSPLVEQVDVVIDACDNFDTRYAINQVCWQHKKPLVSAAAIRLEAQLSTFIPTDPDSPCYQCLYPPGGRVEESCVHNGILAPLTGVVGSMQAIEAIKLLVGFGQNLKGRVLLLDVAAMEWRQITLKKNPNCEICQ